MGYILLLCMPGNFLLDDNTANLTLLTAVYFCFPVNIVFIFLLGGN